MSDPTVDDIRARAERDHAAYPQYHGAWDDPSWVLVRLRRRVRTKSGVAFEAGDMTIGQREADGWTAYSLRTGNNTGLLPEDAQIASAPYTPTDPHAPVPVFDPVTGERDLVAEGDQHRYRAQLGIADPDVCVGCHLGDDSPSMHDYGYGCEYSS